MIEFESKKIEGGFIIPEYIESPISKWQRFKQRYFPFWIIKIFPVKTQNFPLAAFFKVLSKIDEPEGKQITQYLKEESLRIDKSFVG